MSLNLHRRHLDESQRAMVGADIEGYYEDEAKKRQATSTGGKKPQLSANLREAEKGKASEKVAEVVHVSARSVEAASQVLNKGDPALIQAVEDGRVKVSIAAAVAERPKAEQAALVKARCRHAEDTMGRASRSLFCERTPLTLFAFLVTM